MVGHVLVGPVADPWSTQIERPCPGQERALSQVTVAHNAMAPSVVSNIVKLRKDLGDFELQSTLEELSRAFTHELIERRNWTGGGCVRTVGRGAYLLLWACELVTHRVRRPPSSPAPSPTSRHSSCASTGHSLPAGDSRRQPTHEFERRT